MIGQSRSLCLTGVMNGIFFHTDLMFKKTSDFELYRPNWPGTSWNLQNCPHTHDKRSVAIAEDLKLVYIL